MDANVADPSRAVPRLTLVVPCFNEDEVLPATAERLAALLSQLQAGQWIDGRSQVLFVNDGSRDRTWTIICELARQDARFAGLNLSRNYGHQYALLAGLHRAPGDAVISLDADLQDDLAAVPEMLRCFRDGSDIVYGVRSDRSSDNWFKRSTAGLFYHFMQLLDTRTIANHADYRLMSRRALEALRGFEESSLFLRGIIPLIGYRTSTVTYARQARTAGTTKYTLRKMLALSLAAIATHSNFPLHLITVVAFLGTLVTMLIGVWVLYVRFVTPERSVPGWTSILLPVLFVGCVNLFATGLIGEYLARVFDEVKRRPRYLIADAVNLEKEESA